MRWCASGHRMAGDDRFCGICGALRATAGRRCTNGHPANDGERFCGLCGAAISGAGSPDPVLPEMSGQDDTDMVPPWEEMAPPPDLSIAPVTAPGVWPTATPTPPPDDPTTAFWASPTGQLPTPDASASQRPRDGRQRRWPITAAAAIVGLAIIGAGAYFAGQHFSHRDSPVTAARKQSANISSGTAPAPPSTPAATTSSTTSVPSPTTTASAPRPSARQVANRISALIVRSASDRNTVVMAAAELQDCSNVNGALGNFGALEARRRNLIAQLKRFDVSQLTHGATLKKDLTAAWRASLAADEAYATWARDVEGNCTPNQDPNVAQVNTTDEAATRAKTAFASAWNPVATLYSLPTVTQATI